MSDEDLIARYHDDFDPYICYKCEHFGEEYEELTKEVEPFCSNYDLKDPPAFCPEMKFTNRFFKIFKHQINSYNELEVVGKIEKVSRLISMQAIYKKENEIIVQDDYTSCVIFVIKTNQIVCRVCDPKYIGSTVYVYVVWEAYDYD